MWWEASGDPVVAKVAGEVSRENAKEKRAKEMEERQGKAA
ncbi:hypothetical protein KSX_96460 [Ktedonospora formicarum]|uniref:Uncharacterized protein n=1 Tax=Ktedonospora formicarum TaxID=2778364 RepID=A0A8J3IFP3_9CHLR|nr:hypothetical protein KSX_96460 [Ktedonospora formicarum]